MILLTSNQFAVLGVIDMTIQEIRICLKKHGSFVFMYNSQCYTLKRSRFLFCPQYSLIATDALPQRRNSLEKLCEQAYISNGTLLIEVIQYIEIPEGNDPSWETYEAIRHSAIVYGNEIHFSYRGKSYWIAQTSDGSSHLSDDSGNTQWFSSCRDLFDKTRIDGCTLEAIWEKAAVDAC